MKRIGIVGLCLAAMFALSAMAASSAFAGEYGECVKAPKVGKPAKYLGHYTNKECTKKATKAEEEVGKTNKYNWQSAAGKTYTDSTKTAELKSAGGVIKCTASTSTGEITGWQSDTDNVTFTGCELSVTKGLCNSEGEPAGTIKTFALKTFLLDHGTKGLSGMEPKEGEVWTEITAEPGNPTGFGEQNYGEPLQAQYTCAPGVLFQTSGSLSSVTLPVNKMADKFTNEFGAGKGEQDLKTIAFEPGEVNTGPNTEVTKATVENVGKAKTEIRACNEPECEHEEEPPA